MNQYTIALVIVGYSLIGYVMYRGWVKAHKAYNIHYNGSRWVVRDERGRFVCITKSRWDICSLGGGL